jgi:hypothetical protein
MSFWHGVTCAAALTLRVTEEFNSIVLRGNSVWEKSGNFKSYVSD